VSLDVVVALSVVEIERHLHLPAFDRFRVDFVLILRAVTLEQHCTA